MASTDHGIHNPGVFEPLLPPQVRRLGVSVASVVG
jgi:hypothetical protein